MKIKLLLFIIFFISISELKAQITYYDTYESQSGTSANYIQLIKSSTTDGTGRYTYNQSAGTQPTAAGAFYRIKFGNTAHPSSWVLEYSSDGGGINDTWITGFYNNNQLTPLPPSLSYGGWTIEPGNTDTNNDPDVLTTLSGVNGVDVTNGVTVTAPTVTTTTPATNILITSATLGGNVTADGGATLTAKGVVYGSSADPVIGGSGVVASGTAVGIFTISATGLTASTTYHYRAYATNSVGTAYGADQTFTTTALPTVTSVTSSTPNGTYKIGDVIPVQVNFSSAVTVTGTPQLLLETGTTDRTINYSGTGSGTTTLTFNYTVQTGDVSADLDYQSTTALTLNGGTISASGTNATLTLPATGAAGSFGANKAIVIDGQVPTVSSIVRASTNPTNVSTPVNYTVTFSEPVTGLDASDFTFTVLPISGGPTPSVTTVTPVSSTVYTVTVNTGPTSGQFHMDLSASGSGIADLAGNAMTASLQGNVYSITAPPLTVTSVTSSTADGTYKTGDAISVQVNFSAAVTVTGTPQLLLETGTTDRTINYSGTGSGTSTLTFNYTVQSGDNTADLDYQGTTALTLNGGTISASSTNATLTLPAPGAAGSLGANKAIVIDALAPAPPSTPDLDAASDTGTSSTDNLTNLTTPTFTGTAEAGSTVTLYESNGIVTNQIGSATSTGTWSINATAIPPGLHTITATATDAIGNVSVSSSGLGIRIDPIAPTVDITSNVSTLKTGETATITFTFSDDPGTTFTWNGTTGDVVVTGGTLGAISGTGLTRTATFTPTAATNNGTASITVAAAAYTDAAGNNGGAGTTPALTFDTQAPAATSTPDLANASDRGTSNSDNLTSLVTPAFNGTAEIDATVTLYDTDGTTVLGTITADGSGNWSITASTLAPGLHTITAKATDAAGNISIASAGLAITIDTTTPTLAITSNVSSLKIGQTATITFTFSEDPGASFTWNGTAGDIVVTGGTLGAISGTGLTRTATFTPTAATNNGTASITVAAGAYTDAAGNNGGAGTTPALTFDTQAPATPSIPDLASASDGGTSNTDNLTSVTTPTFTGTAEAGATVTLYEVDELTVLGTGTADGSGNWSVTTSVLSLGTHRIKAQAKDAAGNNSSVNGGLVINIDNIAPTLVITSNVSTLKAGETATITFTFSKDPGTTFTWNGTTGDIVVTGGTLGAISGTGLTRTATFTPTAATNNGTASITVAAATYTDAAGNDGGAGTTPALSFDTQLPNAPSTPVLAAGSDTGVSGDNITSVTTPAFTGTAEASATVILYDTNGTTVLGTTTADGSGNWSVISSILAATSHTITAKVQDAAGNISAASAGLAVTIDNTAPIITITSNVSTLKVGETATITFTFSKDPGTTFTWNGTTGDIVVTGGSLGAISGTGLTRTATFTPTAATNNGTASITVAAATYTDAAGNNGGTGTTPALSFDTQLPNAPSTPVLAAGSDTGVSGDNITSVTTPAFTGTAEASATVTLYDTNGTTVLGTIAADGSGNWLITSSILTATSHTITAKATDAAGNISTISAGLTIIVDNTAPNAPSAPLLAAGSDTGVSGDNITSVTTPAFNGTAEPGATVTLYDTDGTTVLGTILADGSGNWSITSSLLAATSHTITAKAKDAAGNISTVSAGLTIIIDNTAPNATSAPVLAAGSDTGVSGDNITSVTTPAFNGTAEPGATVTLYDTDGTTVLGTILADGSGNWSITSSLLAATSHTITAKAKDGSGNTSTVSAGLTIIIDNTPPNTPLVSLPANNALVTVSTPEIKGTAEAGALVTINIDGSVVNTGVTTDGSGNWTYTSSSLPNGSHTVKALATDAAGNASAYSSTITFNINVDPTITATGTLTALTSTYGTASSSTSFTVSGINMTAGVLVTPPAGFEVSIDNAAFNNTVTAGASGVISQLVYVRLKNTAAAATYSGNITLSSAGATSVLKAIPNSTVSPLAIAITADAKGKTYGDADPAFTYTVTTGALVNSDVFAGALTRNPGEDINAYAITQGTLTLGSNYVLAYVPANLTIGTRAVTVTADAKSKTYGTADPALTYTITAGTLNGTDTFTGTLARNPGENVNTYAITQGTLALSNNYTLTYLPANLTIGARAITITADAKTKPYGTADPALTYTVTAGTLSGSDAFTGALVRDAGENMNTYAIKQGTLALNSNYALTYTGANLTITKRVLTITADNQSKVYGSANPALTVKYSGFVNGESQSNFTAQPVISTAATTASGVNTYPITISGATIPNYDIVYVPGTLTVTKAALTITAENKSRNYGVANPTFTVVYSGFMNGDNAAKLSAQPVTASIAGTTSAPGNYPITVNGSASADYTFSYVSGTLTVIPLNGNNVSNLTTSAGMLSPAFTAGTHSYATSVVNGTSNISFTLTFDPTATAKIDGSAIPNGTPSIGIPLNVGNNTISIVVTAQDGVTKNTYTVAVYRGAPAESVTATNILTPNGDGKNDTWVIKDIQLYPNNSVTIYDRAGRTVYSKRGYDNDWDGTLKGAPLAEGTYYYTVDLGPGLPKFRGFITLLRRN